MEAITTLMEEHRNIERVLDALEAAIRRLAETGEGNPKTFLQIAEFSKGYADGVHHRKEEGVLFPAMEAVGIPAEGGPIGVMLAEHQEGRRLVSEIRDAAERHAAGEVEARSALIHSAHAYVDLLRQHIAKEDNVLFPMAEQVLQGPAQAEVTESFNRVDKEEIGDEVHKRFLALAASLEHNVGV